MRDFNDLMNQDLALTVSCRYCGAKAGDRCVTTDYAGRTHVLQNFPAHQKRIARAARQQRMNAQEPK